MEVFLRQVPSHLTEQDLRAELEPLMKSLSITSWTCEKPRRKDMAWVAFHCSADGTKFLKQHGATTEDRNVKDQNDSPQKNQSKMLSAETKPPYRTKAKLYARLLITNKPVMVELSARAVGKNIPMNPQPSPKRVADTKIPERNSRASVISTGVRSIYCGHVVYAGDHSNVLSFAHQCSTRAYSTAKFTNNGITITRIGRFRIDIKSHTIQDCIMGHKDGTLTLILNETPRFYEPAGQFDRFNKWTRREACPDWPEHSIYVAGCLVYQLHLVGGLSDEWAEDFKQRDTISVTRDDLPTVMTPRAFVHDYTTCMDYLEKYMKDHSQDRSALPFSIMFQIQALVSNNYLGPGTALKMAMKMNTLAMQSRLDQKPPPFTVDSVKKVFHQIPYPCPGTTADMLDAEEIVQQILHIEKEALRDSPLRHPEYGSTIPAHQAWIMKAMITPTRILLQGPEPESRNRILRKFPGHTDHFIRCIFCDEDSQQLPFSPKVSNDSVYQRYRAVMKNGITVGGRHFEFLGFSHSSLRSHSVWFMAPFTDKDWKKHSYETLIPSLGNFDKIRVAAKCAARIGQAFSETPYAIPLFKTAIKNRFIQDLKNKDGSRVFSDGVGTISTQAMKEFWAHLPTSSNSPTCFQIRWAGAKGLLVLDTTLKGNVFCIRQESMVKFSSDDVQDMGICDTASKPLRFWLNRQLIKILEDMGTNNRWFFKMQNEELSFLRTVTTTAANTSTFLRYQLIGASVGLPQFIQKLNQMNIDYRQDVFMKTVVEYVVLRELRLLKHKARIPVKKAVTLFGVVDETGWLKEGQIYVTFADTQPIGNPPREGRVIVTRSPALHPGDVQVVTIVTPPQDSPLRALKNCIVFSKNGDRDLPSMLSGGDLDGDLYSVIWDEEALPKRCFEPADYPRVTPKPLDRPVTRDDIADFFINFMKTDILGVIAIRHQVLADYQRDGTADPSCVALAGLHSTAVDSSKTGIPVNIQQLPKPPRARPDFLSPAPPLKLYDKDQIDFIEEDEANDDGDDMSGQKQMFYKSQKILGKLYRNVDENMIWNQHIKMNANDRKRPVWREFLQGIMKEIEACNINIRFERGIKEARKIRRLYESSVIDAMWQFSDNPRTCISEVEVFCGFILNKRGSQTRQQRDSSVKLREEMDRIMDWTSGLIRERAELDQIGILELCVGCLIVGCLEDPTEVNVYHKMGELSSFRVVAACCLIKEVAALRRVDGSGGYPGVRGDRGKDMVLPIR